MAIRATEDRLQRELDGDETVFRPFKSIHQLVEEYFKSRERAKHDRSITNYEDVKDFSGSMDMEISERAARTFGALSYIFKENVEGDCETCENGTGAFAVEISPGVVVKRCHDRERAKHTLSRSRLQLLEYVYWVRYSYTFIAETLGFDDITLNKHVNSALRLIRARAERRGLLPPEKKKEASE